LLWVLMIVWRGGGLPVGGHHQHRRMRVSLVVAVTVAVLVVMVVRVALVGAF